MMTSGGRIGSAVNEIKLHVGVGNSEVRCPNKILDRNVDESLRQAMVREPVDWIEAPGACGIGNERKDVQSVRGRATRPRQVHWVALGQVLRDVEHDPALCANSHHEERNHEYHGLQRCDLCDAAAERHRSARAC